MLFRSVVFIIAVLYYVIDAQNSHAANTAEMAQLESYLRFLGGSYLLHVIVRTRWHIRRSRGIDGDACNDCLLTYFCTACTVAQMDQEV